LIGRGDVPDRREETHFDTAACNALDLALELNLAKRYCHDCANRDPLLGGRG
jgi:hypothetical protein